MNKAITKFLTEHADRNPVSFHMPGHKGSRIYRENGYGDFLDKIMDCDITEIPGADNLFQTEGIIAETMKKYEKLYGVKKSYLLVNGSSGGLIAAILACVRPGGKLIMARNSHKSIFNALGLASIVPVYAYPEEAEGCGILGEVTVDEIARCMNENPDAEAVILPSPNYYGICSNIRAIAEEVHKRGKVLIVDQAHGAHLRFFEKYGTADSADRDGGAEGSICGGFPESAEEQGADIVINSIHKTLASFTQSALLNLCSDRVDPFLLEDKLQTIESSSPSYPMMATLDINADLLENAGERLIRQWVENLDYFYAEAGKIPRLSVLMPKNLDRTKLNIDMSAYGINGNELEELLMERNIFVELVTGNIVMCMTGIGNTRRDYQRLLEALAEIAEQMQGVMVECTELKQAVQPKVLTRVLKQRAVPAEKEFVTLKEAEGRVCASSIIPYPPGIPIVCPGEVIDEDVIDYIKERREAGEKVIGLTAEGTVCVGKWKRRRTRMDIKKLKTAHREVAEMAECKEIFWTNPKSGKEKKLPFNMEDICEAEARLKRFAPYIAKAFPETAVSGGTIESELVEIPKMKKELEKMCGEFGGRLYLKCDSNLPVSGSIKARGGIYEVLKFAEKVAMEAGMLSAEDDYSVLAEPRFRELFSTYSVAVGSTGNLGLSIGIISAKLGFKVTVHMSADARQWKKDLLRSKGVTVVEYPDDYQKAVAEGRKEAASDPHCHFVDDEASPDLFMGYSVAARRIGAQFEKLGITVDDEHPLFVYIPCGVGGAPGGVAFGLKEVYGDNVHIFFAEPTHAPCMTLSMITGLKNEIAVSDIGLDGKTEADGLAVGRASVLVSDIMETLLDGCYTIEDDRLYPFLARLADTENIFIEPSSCASFPGPSLTAADTDWLEKRGLADKMKNAAHILWATGGSMVPEDEMRSYYRRGK